LLCSFVSITSFYRPVRIQHTSLSTIESLEPTRVISLAIIFSFSTYGSLIHILACHLEFIFFRAKDDSIIHLIDSTFSLNFYSTYLLNACFIAAFLSRYFTSSIRLTIDSEITHFQ